MAFPKGGKNPAAGRKAGSPNKTTMQAREAIAAFVEGNVDRLNGWLDQIAEKDPAAAFDRFMNVVEYHIPKLQRQEITGANGGAIKTETALTIESDAAILRRYEQQRITALKVLEDRHDEPERVGSEDC